MTSEAIEAVLADFRGWLQEMAAEAPAALPPVPDDHAEPIDLHTLLGQFLALKHEVNLQTRATRAQQEQNAETVRQLSQALESLRQARAAEHQADEQAQEERLRPVLKTLVDLGDALHLARGEVERVRTAIDQSLDQLVAAEAGTGPAVAPRRSLWERWFGRGPAEQPEPAEPERRQGRQTAERIGHLLDSILTGYTMSLQRVERALQQQGLEPIECTGQAFDPERMEVLEVVADRGRAPGEVVAEVRRGYVRHGRVFRYALVRVAKP